MRALVVGASLLSAGLWISPASAQNPEAVAKAACEQAVSKKLRRLYSKADTIEFGRSRMIQISNAENGVFGTGEVGRAGFTYRCVHNVRDGSTSGVSVKPR